MFLILCHFSLLSSIYARPLARSSRRVPANSTKMHQTRNEIRVHFLVHSGLAQIGPLSFLGLVHGYLWSVWDTPACLPLTTLRLSKTPSYSLVLPQSLPKLLLGRKQNFHWKQCQNTCFEQVIRGNFCKVSKVSSFPERGVDLWEGLGNCWGSLGNFREPFVCV